MLKVGPGVVMSAKMIVKLLPELGIVKKSEAPGVLTKKRISHAAPRMKPTMMDGPPCVVDLSKLASKISQNLSFFTLTALALW